MALFKKLLPLTVFICITTNLYGLEWYQEYENGKKAVDKGKCSEGTSLMLEALRKNPKPDNKARPYGMVTLEYTPHFYLAKCALETGDYASAERYIKAAEQGGIYTSSKAAEMRQIKHEVDQQLQGAKTQTPVTAPPKKTVPVKPSSQPVTKQQQQQQPPPATKPVQQPATDNQQVLVDRALKEARDAFRLGDYDSARSAANRVLMLDRVNEEASQLLNQIGRKEEQERDRVQKDQMLADARRALKSGQLLSAENLAIQLRSQFPNDDTVANLLSEIQKRKQTQMQNMAAEETRKLLEKQVLIAYYSGKYEVVVQLADQGLNQYPDSWRLHFFEGCAYAALGLLNEKNENNLSKARESFRKAKAISGSFAEPPQISPKILNIFRNS